MNIKIHDDQNIKIYRQDQYCWNFLLPQVPAWFHTALTLRYYRLQAPLDMFPPLFGAQDTGRRACVSFFFKGFSFASQDLHLSPGPTTHLAFPFPQPPKDDPTTSVAFLGLSFEATLFFFFFFTVVLPVVFPFSSDDFSSISSFVFHTVGTPSHSNPAWGKVSVFLPSGNVEFVRTKALDLCFIFLVDLWNYEDVWRDLDLASVILGPQKSPLFLTPSWRACWLQSTSSTHLLGCFILTFFLNAFSCPQADNTTSRKCGTKKSA